MWKGWRGDVQAALVGLALVPFLVLALGCSVMAWKATGCDDQCEMEGGWLLPGMARSGGPNPARNDPEMAN